MALPPVGPDKSLWSLDVTKHLPGEIGQWELIFLTEDGSRDGGRWAVPLPLSNSVLSLDLKGRHGMTHCIICFSPFPKCSQLLPLLTIRAAPQSDPPSLARSPRGGGCHMPTASGCTEAKTRVLLAAFHFLGTQLCCRPDSGLENYFITWWSGSKLIWVPASRPVEFRSRQTSTSVGPCSLFLPPESAGPQAAFSSEPISGTIPGIPVGPQQAGEDTEKRQRCQIHRPGTLLVQLLHYAKRSSR